MVSTVQDAAQTFDLLASIIIILAVVFTIFTILVVFSPRVRGWFMSLNVKAKKHMMDNSKEDIASISSDMADATKEGIETTARAIKKGLTEDSSSTTEKMYCKHCGKEIDIDSTFCKYCGKEQ